MGRVNTWLLRHLDRLPEPTPLPPKLEQLRVTIDRRMSRAVTVTILGVGGLSILSPLLLALPYGALIFVPLIFAVMFAVTVAQSYHSRAAVRDYTAWLAAQPRPQRRVTRVGVPYDRQPPTASVACMDCPAQPGQRHSRSCPSVPPEWFSRGR